MAQHARMITANELRKSFDTLRAVDGVSFNIAMGETFGLLGPNSAGKTTTISMLCGLLPPDSGTVTVEGGGAPTEAHVRRRLGVAPQSLAIYPELTAEENVAFFGKLYGLRGGALRGRVEAVLAFVGLSDRRKDRAKTYSGGMQRRLNIACALVHEPKVLFLDEPTAGVDPQSRNMIFEKIEEAKRDGMTILYTTHYMEEAERLCDRVAIVDKGRVLALDTVPALKAAHGGPAEVLAELEGTPEHAMKLPGAVEDGVLRIQSPKPFEAIAQLGALGVRFRRLEVRQPTLESVFLNLTGRSLRDQ